VPTARMVMMPSTGLEKSPHWSGENAIAVNIAAKPAIEPIERSKCPEIRQIPSASTRNPRATEPWRMISTDPRFRNTWGTKMNTPMMMRTRIIHTM